MPYKGNQVSLLAILPNDVEGIETLLEKLKDPSLLDTETNNLQQVEVEVSFPKFKIETTTNLIKVLKKKAASSPALPDVPIFTSKLNVPRGTGSVLLFGDNSTVLWERGQLLIQFNLQLSCEEFFVLIKEKKETLKDITRHTKKYHE